jgi:hypothetical protein
MLVKIIPLCCRISRSISYPPPPRTISLLYAKKWGHSQVLIFRDVRTYVFMYRNAWLWPTDKAETCSTSYFTIKILLRLMGENTKYLSEKINVLTRQATWRFRVTIVSI